MKCSHLPLLVSKTSPIPLKFPLMIERELTPVAIKSQGFLFKNSSGLIYKSESFISPNFCLSLYIRVNSDGIIFRGSRNSCILLQIFTIEDYLFLNISYTKSSNSNIFSINTTEVTSNNKSLCPTPRLLFVSRICMPKVRNL